MPSRMPPAVRYLLLFVIATSLAACDKSIPSSASAKIRLSTSKNVWCSLVLIADHQGYFKDEGLDVALSYTDGGRYCLDALLSNSSDAGTIVETNISYLGFTGNQTILVVGNVVESTSIAIVARRSSGITELEDLIGKRLGYAPGMQGEIFANRILAKHAIDIAQIDIQKLQPKAIPPALDGGAIDAASTWEPFVYACVRALGDDAVVFRDPEAHKGYMHLAVRKDWANRNPEAVTSLLKALDRAARFVREHHPQAQEIMAETMNVDLELIKAIWPYFEIDLTFDAQDVTEAITAEGEWIRESQERFADKPLPSYSMYVDSQYFSALGK